MVDNALKVALVDGPTYEPLYSSLGAFEESTGIKVEVGFKGPHPDLNRHVQEAFSSGKAEYDLISTHTKYAPSQAEHLLPLDEYFSEEELQDLSPVLVELARVNGGLMSIPRNFDARLLFYRRDRFAELGLQVPDSWEELMETVKRATAAGYTGFVYPGKESGLFGTFFELLMSEGGKLFDEKLQSAFNSTAGIKVLKYLKELYQQGLTPANLPDMHYDEVSESFRNGDSLMVADWPGYFGLLSDPACQVANCYGLALLPKGSTGKRAVYCGSHSFAVTTASCNPQKAVQLLKYLTSPERQMIDADSGHVPVRFSVMDRQKGISQPGTIEALRWQFLEETMAKSVVIPPKFAEYPETEDILWNALRACIKGDLSEEQALKQAEDEINMIVRKYA
ncbi:extracellular solute-binding protein [Paenibacillus sp. KQZ6P-2]|uniref:Extracellular solute-binding protein n=1 Tax=Paenibacillus mangrovi TaxID=2931978 RepID=A0A9X1WT95_9BACL|nr:extracellular solute-binding protein [Paenibacillus mangrovi]MCJ8013510.1 extracellular solute-binding protein [Paenibacillus mangrovi]